MHQQTVIERMDVIEQDLQRLEQRIQELQECYEQQLGSDCAQARADAKSIGQMRHSLKDARDELQQSLRSLRVKIASYAPDTEELKKAASARRIAVLGNLQAALSAMGLSVSSTDFEEDTPALE